MRKFAKLLIWLPVASLGLLIAAGCNKDQAADNPPEPQKPPEQGGAAADRGGLGEPTLNPKDRKSVV